METIKFIYRQENDIWVGWLKDYPDYHSKGTNLDELKENLKDIYKDLNTGKIPHLISLHPFRLLSPHHTKEDSLLSLRR